MAWAPEAAPLLASPSNDPWISTRWFSNPFNVSASPPIRRYAAPGAPAAVPVPALAPDEVAVPGDAGRGEVVVPLGGIAPVGVALVGGVAGAVAGGVPPAGGLALGGTGETVVGEIALDPAAEPGEAAPVVPPTPGEPGDPAEPIVGLARMNDAVAAAWPRPPTVASSCPD